MGLSALEVSLLTILGTVLVGLLAWFLYRAGKVVCSLYSAMDRLRERMEALLYNLASQVEKPLKQISSSLRQLEDSMNDLRAASVLLTKAVEGSKKDFENGPKLIAGLVRIAEAQVVEIQKLREAVTQFSSVVVAPAADGKDALQTYNEEDAGKAFSKRVFMGDGLSEEEADIQADIGGAYSPSAE